MLKTIKELTREELLNLSSEDKAAIIDYESALRGIKLLPNKPIKPIINKPKEDVKIYKVGEFKFTDKFEAERLVEVLEGMSSQVDLNSKNWSDYYVEELSEYHQPKLEIITAFSKETFEDVQQQLSDYKKATANYEELKKEYDSIYADIMELEKELNTRIDEAIDYQRDLEKYTNLYARYKALANGDTRLAKKFLFEAYSDAENYFEIFDKE